jgi:hypothetical protein
MFLSSRQFLNIVGRRYPTVYGVVIPHSGALSQIASAELNPKPLPPHDPGSAIATEFIHSIWIADRFGLDASSFFSDLEKGKLKLPKLPPWFPPSPPEPDPQPEWFVDFYLEFAARITAVSPQFEGTQLGESLGKAIERSVSTIESSLATMSDGSIV